MPIGEWRAVSDLELPRSAYRIAVQYRASTAAMHEESLMTERWAEVSSPRKKPERVEIIFSVMTTSCLSHRCPEKPISLYKRSANCSRGRLCDEAHQKVDGLHVFGDVARGDVIHARLGDNTKKAKKKTTRHHQKRATDRKLHRAH